jgi:hypothetical protein
MAAATFLWSAVILAGHHFGQGYPARGNYPLGLGDHDA